MSKYKDQHVNAKFYLKGFSFKNPYNEKENNLYVGEIQNNFVNKNGKGIKNINVFPDIYSNVIGKHEYNRSFEQDLGEIESKLKPIISYIEDNVHRLKNGDTSNLYLLGNERQKIIDLFSLLLRKNLLYKFVIDSDLIADLEQKNALLSNKDLFYETLLNDPYNVDLYKILGNKKWQIFYINNDDIGFLTSDTPIFWGGDKSGLLSLKEENTPIIMPLTKNILIQFFGADNTGTDNLSYIEWKDYKTIDFYNNLITSNASKEIYGDDIDYVRKKLQEIKDNKRIQPNSIIDVYKKLR